MTDLTRESCKYWPFYCEENIWHLCQDPRLNGQDFRVVFVTNTIRTCLFHFQKLGTIFWDYHVVLLVDGQVWDLDSELLFPIDIATYLLDSFFPKYKNVYLPVFYEYSGAYYSDAFYSDRRHMRDDDGTLLKPPPPWPAIRPGKGSNLKQFLSAKNPNMIQISTLDQMLNRHRDDNH